MNCPLDHRDNAEILVAYSSRRLKAERAASLETHLQACPACRDFVRDQQAVWEMLDLWEPASVSPDFNRRLYHRIERQNGWREMLAQLFRPLFGHHGIPLAAAAGVVFAAALLLNPSTAPPPAATGPGGTPQDAPAVAQADTLQPEQVVNALNELEALSQFDRLMKSETHDRM
jgi:hypothetical protein